MCSLKGSSGNSFLQCCQFTFQIHTSQGADGTPTVHAVQALAEVATAQGDGLAVDLNNVTEATLNQDGQLILTGEDGHGM